MTVQVQGDSQEAVAFGLMQCVLLAAGRGNNDHPFPVGSTLLRGHTACNERDILQLFARCLRVVKGVDADHGIAPAVQPGAPAERTSLHS